MSSYRLRKMARGLYEMAVVGVVDLNEGLNGKMYEVV
jgi:hypothetical protein